MLRNLGNWHIISFILYCKIRLSLDIGREKGSKGDSGAQWRLLIATKEYKNQGAT